MALSANVWSMLSEDFSRAFAEAFSLAWSPRPRVQGVPQDAAPWLAG